MNRPKQVLRIRFGNRVPGTREALVLLAALAVTVSVVPAQPLQGTGRWTLEGDPAARMVEEIDRYLSGLLAESGRHRKAYWSRLQGPGSVYREQVGKSRARLAEIIGAVDRRVDFEAPEVVSPLGEPVLLASSERIEVYSVRWPVFEGVRGEGLLFRPRGAPLAGVIAVPDADWTPESFGGLLPGVAPERQLPRLLAERGCLVLVPSVMDRASTYSGKAGVARTDQSHREFIYRMAYEMGRHIIGYEVQKILAAADWLAREGPERPLGVAGSGEGGLLALYAAALDTRFDAALTSGYFGPRERVWEEPIYRNVWSQLEAFGDAEIAGMVAPRPLIVEADSYPVSGRPPEPGSDRIRVAAPGRLEAPSPVEVEAEFERAAGYYAERGGAGKIRLFPGGSNPSAAYSAFCEALDMGAAGLVPGSAPLRLLREAEPEKRQRRQFDELVEFTQRLVRESEFRRRDFFPKAEEAGAGNWEEQMEPYRRHLWEEVIGRMPPPSEPLAAETRLLYDEPAYRGYEVFLPVWGEVFAYGILLVPRELGEGEKRPVVICQHGLEGRPEHLIEPPDERLERVYGRYAARLAEEGFIVYAPQNPYIGRERFRVLQRKAHPLKLSLFSFIVGQHQRTLEWLGGLPFVDRDRMGFYGLSYGGKTAMRVPALLKEYALSICSADFNEWIWKITDVDHRFSYMYTVEHDMLEFNLGNTFNYAEMAGLIAPRPFMVERGHRDGVGIDEWVAYEYARVRRLYVDLGIPERTAIEFFDGPHQIHGEGTFEFLRKHLEHPEDE